MSGLWLGNAGLFGGFSLNTSNTFAELPAPASVASQRWWVLVSTGVWLVNRKTKGAYHSDGVVWSYLGDFPVSAAEISFTPGSGIEAVNAQSAIEEVVSDTGVLLAGKVSTGAVTTSGLTMSTARLLGRGSAAAGALEEIILGTNLSMTGTTLNAAGGGGGSGTVTSVSVTTAAGVSGTVATATTTPAITITLGAITPSSVASTGAVTGTNLSGTNTGDQTNISGNAGTVTTNANLTGHITSTGNAAILGIFTIAQLNTAISDADVSVARVIGVISINTTATAGLADYVYLVSGTTTLTLPTAVGRVNMYTVKNVGVGVVTIQPQATQTIDGSANATLPVQYTSISLVSDGSHWNVV